MNKKSQITIFIIIGILLIITIAIFTYIQKERVYIEPELIEPELVPIKNYVESCIAAAGEDAVGLLGLQGGYIEIPKEISEEKYAYIEVDETGFFKIPFWYYNGQSRIPGIDFMENQISEYVKDNVKECIREFIAFEKEFDITEIKNINSKTIIQENSVLVQLDYPVKIKDKGQGKVSYIKDFSAVVPVKLKQAYDLGVDIIEQENKDLYFEDITIDLMALHPEIPFTGMEFTCKQKKWF
ncbi:unnamed protein product, partial [marine sediment metagenome]